MKKMLSLLLAVVMLLSVLAACNTDKPVETQPEETQGNTPVETQPTETTAPVDPEAEKYGGHLNVAHHSKPSSLDPAKYTGTWGYMVMSLVYEAPLTRDAEGNIRPNVCDFEISEDMLTLKLWVREGVTFHDGSEVEIEDVIASIKRCVHKSPRNEVSAYIKDVTYEGDVATITFTEYNEKTMSYIASINPLIGVMPKEIAEKYSYESEQIILDVADAIGTGPYKFVGFEDSVKFELERYDGYISVEEGYTGFAAPKKAYLDSITITYKSDENAANIALMKGQFDLSEGVGDDYTAQLEQAGIVTVKKEAPTASAMVFNTFGTGIVANNANLRKAILAAMDIPEFIEVTESGRYGPAPCPVVDGQYYTDLFSSADYMGEDNVELAKKYLAAAGYNGEELQIVYYDARLTHITLLCSYLDAAGIKYKTQMLESGAATEILGQPDGAWDIKFSYPSLPNTPALFSAAIISTDYNSAEKDALVKNFKGLLAGTQEYKDNWAKLAEVMVDDAAIAFLGQTNHVWSMDPELNLDYVGTTPYLFNTYWTNPADHTK